jgi:flagellar export protein FliJ
MKRFKFPLESLRRYRQWQQQQLEYELAGLQRELSSQQHQLASLTDELRQTSGRRIESPAQVRLHHRLAEAGYANRIRDLIAEKQLLVQELQNAYRQLREQVLSVTKDVESLETLRTEKHSEHQMQSSKQRQQELDDHITNSWFHDETEDTR